MSVFTTTMEAKRLDLLHQAFPQAELIGVLVDPTYPGTEVQLAELQAAAAAQAFPIVIFNASTESELETAFVKLSEAAFFAHGRNDLVQCQVRLLDDQGEQEFRMLLKRRSAAATRLCRSAGGFPPSAGPKSPRHSG